MINLKIGWHKVFFIAAKIFTALVILIIYFFLEAFSIFCEWKIVKSSTWATREYL